MSLNWSTLALQMVNLLVLIWLLQRLLYRPIVNIMAQRRAQADGVLSAARAEAEQARRTREQLAAEREMALTQHANLLATARADAEQLRTQRLGALEAELARRRDGANAQLAAERVQAQQQINQTALALAAAFAQRALQRLPPDALLAAYLDSLGPAPHVQVSGTARVSTANALDALAQAALAQRLNLWLGQPLGWEFAVEPALLAGLSLDIGDLHLEHSLAGDLSRLAQDALRDHTQ